MHKNDTLQRFLIESADVRGSLVSLDDAWREARGRIEYPWPVQQVLGHAFAASALLATTIKFEGKITLQIRGDGPVHLLVIQVTADNKLRGLARWSSVPTGESLHAQFGENARMTITIEANPAGEPYQGIVALEGNSLSDALRDYFINSEQLETELILAVDDSSAVGLLLQKLPADMRVGQGADNDSYSDDGDKRRVDNLEGWNRTLLLARTVKPAELLTLSKEELLNRLYHEEHVRLFDPQAVAFECSCSKSRTDGLIQGLGIDEAQSILQEQGDITINCEFCDQVYRYEATDVVALFKEDQNADVIKGPTLH